MTQPDNPRPPEPPASDERWQEVEALAREALEHADADREAFLDAACPDDPWVRDKTRELVEAHARAGPSPGGSSPGKVFLRSGFVPLPAVEVEPGFDLGPFRILERIGEGAMAKVYRAERRDDLEGLVAVKIAQRDINAALASRLFRVETEVLGRLDHPNVLELVAGGTLGDGRPYIVAEFVDGLPIDEYCDQMGLGLEGRLDLFLQACAAVDHVHRHQVVHRDIKPRNLLVTKGGVAKLVDFGIALAIEGGSAAPGPPTERPMTPQYASPEQVRGRAITPRSDVYSLGVVLYKLTTGRLPYGDADDVVGPREMARLFDRGEAPRPSEATASAEMKRRLEGDLEKVILRALAQDPEARQAGAEELAAELRRWTAGSQRGAPRASAPPTADQR